VATIREMVMPRRLSTPRLIVVGFLALMALGTVLLKLPVSTERGISWVDAMFVSVSAGSVTGLSTVDFPATFTTFGAVVVMVLVQLGGLGIMTVTTMAALFIGQRVGFRNLIAVRESIESVDSPRNILRLLLQIARITFAVELLAAAALSVAFIRRGMAPSEGIFQGVFHAIMSFCNAGLVNLESGSFIPYAGNWLVVGTLALAIILGGLGFPVLVDLYRYRTDRRLTVHSRLVLITSAVLLFVGIASVAATEWSNAGTLGGQPLSTRLAMSVFQGVTARTAGFFTVNYPDMRDPTLVVQTLLMFVGTAPTSTGGGIKVTTLALVFLIIVSQVRGQDRITLFWRTLPQSLVAKALSVLSLASLLVLISTLVLMISDGLELLPALFEVTSAFGTVGLSLDVTPNLSTFGKVLISVVMFLGRVGPTTFVVALAIRQRTPHYKYPEEEIAIG
jgi:trk system potassium uptake protein